MSALRMCRSVASALLIWTFVSIFAGRTLAAQANGTGQLQVFLDCNNCYADFLRTEVAFVNYVRDRTEADIHLLITRAQTGSGGSEFTLAFIGGARFPQITETIKT